MKPFLGKRGTASTTEVPGLQRPSVRLGAVEAALSPKICWSFQVGGAQWLVESAATAGRAAVLGGFGTGNGGEEEPTAATAGRE